MNLENNASPRTPPVLGIDTQSAAKSALNTPPSTATSISSASPPTSIPSTHQLGFARVGRNTQPSDDTIRLAAQLVKQHDSQIGHYGLTAANVVVDQSAIGVATLPAHNQGLSPVPLTIPPILRPAHAWKPPESQDFIPPAPKSHSKRKRSVDASHLDSPFRAPLKKSRRLPPGKIDLGHIRPPRTQAELVTNLPPGVSPLFFSSSTTKRLMTGRPPSFSTAEPAAVMLNRLHDGQNAVKTVKLPKGHISTMSPARSFGIATPGSAGSDSLSSRSGDQRQLPPELRDLQGLSVIDLLEADERPTFIIDLSNNANFGPGPLKPLFLNASLKASRGVHELITQSSEHSPDFSRFKSWAGSFVKDQRSMNVALPSISYGGVVWTCSTLANRFRVVSGSHSAVSITPTSPAPPARASSVLEHREQRYHSTTSPRESRPPGRERALSDLDYFGDADPNPSVVGGRRAHSEPRDLDDVRPNTPVIPAGEHLEAELESELIQTFDWTRIQDISGIYPFLKCLLQAGFCARHGRLEEEETDVAVSLLWDQLRGMTDFLLSDAVSLIWQPLYMLELLIRLPTSVFILRACQ